MVRVAVARGANVRPEALDFARGHVVLQQGRRLTDRDLALAASMNYPRLPVFRRPKIGILGTGDELVPPGGEPGPGQIVYSNGFALAALARAQGAEVEDFGVVPDRLDALGEGISRLRASGADVLVTTGGASVGEYDLVGQALAAHGMELSFWKVAIRPGRPMLHGRLGTTSVLGLPGNPVSSYVCACLFLVPLIGKLGGAGIVGLQTVQAVLGTDLRKNDERTDYLRASLEHRPDGAMLATPFFGARQRHAGPACQSGLSDRARTLRRSRPGRYAMQHY